jgi:hypothetical protein
MSRRKRHVLDARIEVFLKAFDRRRILVGILIDDLRRVHLRNLCITIFTDFSIRTSSKSPSSLPSPDSASSISLLSVSEGGTFSIGAVLLVNF